MFNSFRNILQIEFMEVFFFKQFGLKVYSFSNTYTNGDSPHNPQTIFQTALSTFQLRD